MKKSCIVFFFCCFITAAFSQETANHKDYTEAFTLAEAWLDAQKDYEQLPGLSAAFVQDQQIIWSYATGRSNKEVNVRAEASTLYSICSISKLFTSVVVMKLYDEGKLRLDDRISIFQARKRLMLRCQTRKPSIPLPHTFSTATWASPFWERSLKSCRECPTMRTFRKIS